jgi:proteasome accessory factor B
MDRTYYALFHRLLELDSRIRGGKYPNALSFSQEWEVSQKTVQRDIEYLRDSLGAPLEYDRIRKGYRYTDKTWFLPALNLSAEELKALLLAQCALEPFRNTPLARHLQQVFRKIAEAMPERLPVPPEIVFSRFSFVSPAAKPINEKIWSTIVTALLTQRSVKMSYRRASDGSGTERTVDPYHIANLHGEWYVFALCHRAKALRQFGIPQIQKAELTTEPFELPRDFDIQKLLANAFRRQVLGEKMYKVRLRFDASVADRILERQWHPRQKSKRLTNGAVEIAFETPGLFEVSRWVLSWGAHATVLGPKELQDRVNHEIQLLIRNKRSALAAPRRRIKEQIVK